MKNNISMNISINEVKDILKYYLITKGYNINRDDINFNISTRESDGKYFVENCTINIKLEDRILCEHT